uniref:Uncharacterized protein n=1 Tax=Ascaris lumbricoides TaxID=6252 RepID=A0A9J2PAV2_ASCLU
MERWDKKEEGEKDEEERQEEQEDKEEEEEEEEKPTNKCNEAENRESRVNRTLWNVGLFDQRRNKSTKRDVVNEVSECKSFSVSGNTISETPPS